LGGRNSLDQRRNRCNGNVHSGMPGSARAGKFMGTSGNCAIVDRFVRGGSAMTEYHVRSPGELQAACEKADAGDTILVYGGLYDTPSKLTKRGSAAGPYITIKAADDQWIRGGRKPDPWWGGSHPSADSPGKPVIGDFAFLVIDKCAYVAIDG